MKFIIPGIGIIIGLIGFYFYQLESEPDQETITDPDTGFTRHETEE